MNYVCVDRGTERCPCILMEAGQCYTCTMVKEGTCSCEDKAGWTGTCPYTEYLQNGSRIMKEPSDRLSPFDVLSKTYYAENLFTVKLAVPAGFADRCRRPGAYVMAEAMDYRTPVSVLRAERFVPGDFSYGAIELLVKEVGPKTMELGRETVWKMAGPYYNGLLNTEKLSQGRPVLVIARGTAAAPFINMMDTLQAAGSSITLYLDDESLPEEFLEEYLNGLAYETVRLQDEETLERMKRKVKEGLGNQVMVLASPYYTQGLTEGLTEKEKAQIILANHGNFCCGMGICGACSHTDGDGITVRLCKCSRTVVK